MNNRQSFLMHQAQTTHFPMMLEIARAEGNYLFDVTGKKYLDLISGISVNHLGHGNQAVKNAMIAQMDLHQHVMVYGEFVQSAQAQLAQRLCDLLPSSLNSVYLLNSGAEATDLALKLAKRVTGKWGLVACKNAYHGSSHAALSLNSDEYYKQAFRPLLPGVSFIQFNNLEDVTRIEVGTACVITEVVQGEAGYIAANDAFLKALRAKCDEIGALLVFDEIQSGMGKTGKMFAFEHYGVVPDILLLGKALGAGMPIGAVVSAKEKMDLLADKPILGHITTFGGHPVVAAAALAGIKVLLDGNFMDEVVLKEARFRANLQHNAIVSISGKGLMLALELDSFENTLMVVQSCLRRGLISDWFLFASNRLRMAPPLTITIEEIDLACEIIKAALDEVYAVSA
ncbi:MAG: aspartate aminotransferase family protein [bacterium]|nr:aspartate aminotransferase family protein [bacterium]